MTQFQFDSILKIVELGAPVLYRDLGNALNDLVVERNTLFEKNKDLEAQIEALKNNTESEKA